MLSSKRLSIFLPFVIAISGQLVFPKLPAIPLLPGLPELPELPTPEKFIENLLNVTPNELLDVVSSFTFDDILSQHIRFLLYNKNGSVTTVNTYSDKIRIKNNSEPIKFVIHGWQATGDQDFIKNIVKSYHAIGIYNVFGVDWSSHSKRDYLHSARGTKKVGEYVGEFIMNLIKNDTKLLPNVHLIGHSLGAQVSGFAGKQIKSLTNGLRVGRITGLDAAAPLFEFPIKMPSHLRLTNEDADYVDGIHTNAGFFGFLAPFGDADYYVGFGGPIQDGCVDSNVFEAFVCSHLKSHDIYNRTITSTSYLATSCGNLLRAISHMCDKNKKVVMGEHTSKDAIGDYFIHVDDNNLPKKESAGDVRSLLNKLPQLYGLK